MCDTQCGHWHIRPFPSVWMLYIALPELLDALLTARRLRHQCERHSRPGTWVRSEAIQTLRRVDRARRRLELSRNVLADGRWPQRNASRLDGQTRVHESAWNKAWRHVFSSAGRHDIDDRRPSVDAGDGRSARPHCCRVCRVCKSRGDVLSLVLRPAPSRQSASMAGKMVEGRSELPTAVAPQYSWRQLPLNQLNSTYASGCGETKVQPMEVASNPTEDAWKARDTIYRRCGLLVGCIYAGVILDCS